MKSAAKHSFAPANNGRANPDRGPAATSCLAGMLNRAAVFDLIRKRQPLSRADLARVSGMQRSTISHLVDQLVEDCWLVEDATFGPCKGRPPTLLALNTNRAVIGVELQDARISVAAGDLTGTLAARETAALSLDPDLAAAQILEGIRETLHLCRGKTIEGVGISLAGRWNPQVNLRGHPQGLAPRIRARIAEETGLEVALDNAANACLVASVLFDGLEYRNVAAVRVSDDIEVGMLANGQLVRGRDGLAGRFGHVSLDPDGPPCGECGGRGCWASFASNSATLQRYLGPGVSRAGMRFDDLPGLAERGDARAGAVLEDMAHYLARGFRIIAAALAPECILVVGDLAASWHRLGPLIEGDLAAHGAGVVARPKLLARNESSLLLRGAVGMVLSTRFPLNHWFDSRPR